MDRCKRWGVTAGAAAAALLLGTCMLAVNVYGSDFVTDAVLEEVQGPEESGEDIFSDGQGGENNQNPEENGNSSTGDNMNMESIESGAMGGYSSGYSGGGSVGSVEKITRQPKMMLESCNLSGTDLQAGSEQMLEAVFVNKSRGDGIYNLKVTLASDAKDLYLSEKSFYFGKIPANGEICINSNVKILPGAEEGFFSVTASLEYEDKKGTACTGSEKIELQIVQPPKVHLECESIPATAMSTDTMMIPVKVQNLSRAAVNNVRVALKGKGLFPKEKIFVGNMEPGTQGEGTMRVYVGTRTMKKLGMDEGSSESERYGEIKGKLILAYEDSLGKTYTEEKKFEMEIKKPKIQSFKVEAPKKANSWWFSIAAAGGIGMVMIILLLIGKLRRQSIRMEEMKKAYGGKL